MPRLRIPRGHQDRAKGDPTQFHALQTAGHNASGIMRETGLGRTYVRTWIRLEALPERNRMEPRVGMAAFYREYLIRRWTEGNQSVRLLMAELETLGYVLTLLAHRHAPP